MIEKTRLLILGLLVLMIINLASICSVNALTASVNGGKAIVRANVGDVLERELSVPNSNNISVDIEITADTNSGNIITIEDDKNFSLEAKEERTVYYSIEVKKSGTTENNIYIKFIPEGEKAGVGVIASITVIANGTDSGNDNIRLITGDIGSKLKNISLKYWIVGFSTLIVLILFIYVLRLASRKQKEFESSGNLSEMGETSEQNFAEKTIGEVKEKASDEKSKKSSGVTKPKKRMKKRE
jgi:hypothetical protein